MDENEILSSLNALHSKILKSQFAQVVTEGEIRALTEYEDMLNESKQYQAIGTVEECQEAVEKQKAKKPDIWGDGCDDEGNMIYDMYNCPNCGKEYEIDYEKHDFCPHCGQAIDWRGDDDGE